ncbi:MAG: hypothetical protein ABI399_04210 [Bauldia sp.]
MIFSLDVRRARKGDCLLLHSGTKGDPGLIIIDGGPPNVYRPQLAPRIESIRKARKLADEESLTVDALMVSHVDDDHIRGILELGDAESDRKRAKQPQKLNVLGFWHNSFDEVISHNTKEITAALNTQFPTASTTGDLPEEKKEEVHEESAEDEEVVDSGLEVLASLEQGFRLRQIADFLGWPRNPPFDGKLVIARDKPEELGVAAGLTFTVAGPMQPELDALRKKHLEWLEDLKKKGKSPPKALAAYIDKSVPNLSSLVVLAKSGKKSILLTGDARGDRIIAGLQHAKLLKAGKTSTIKVDILKVPHHGSSNNLDKDFFERIIADHYVFSGDGEHGNPERESLEMLFDARGSDPLTVHLTYPVAEIDKARKAEWEKQQAKEKKRKAKNGRPNWSPETHSLASFFKARKLPSARQKIEIVGDGPHVIDLLDPLGF